MQHRDTRAGARAATRRPRASEARNSTAAPAPDDALVIERAGLQAIGRGGRGRARAAVHRATRAAPVVPTAPRRAGRRTCRPSRQRNHSPRHARPACDARRSARHRRTPAPRPRAPARAGCATSLTVPSALEAAPTASSRTPRVSLRATSSSSSRPSSGRMRITRTSSSRSRASTRQVSELAWWSSSVTTTASPVRHPCAERAPEVKGQRGHVGAEDDLLGPTRRASRPARHGRASSAASVSWLVG